MERFLVFMYDENYPVGGFNDFKGSYKTEKEIFALCSKGGYKFQGGWTIKFKKQSFEILMIVDTQHHDSPTEYCWNDIKVQQ